jgi:hypothetical protein
MSEVPRVVDMPLSTGPIAALTAEIFKFAEEPVTVVLRAVCMKPCVAAKDAPDKALATSGDA